MERQINGDTSNEELTKKILDNAGPAAAMSMVHLALHGSSESVRLQAARYITDKFYDDTPRPDDEPLWAQLLADAVDVKKLEDYANQQAH